MGRHSLTLVPNISQIENQAEGKIQKAIISWFTGIVMAMELQRIVADFYSFQTDYCKACYWECPLLFDDVSFKFFKLGYLRFKRWQKQNKFFNLTA